MLLSGFPGYKHCWFPKTDVIGALLPGASSLGFGARCGSQSPYSSGKASTLMGHCTGGVLVLMRPPLHLS